MLEKWLHVQESNAQQLANSQSIRKVIYPLLNPPDDGDPAATVTSSKALHAELQKHLAATMSSHDYVGYFVADAEQRIVSASNPALLGQQRIPEFSGFLDDCLNGKTIVSTPFASVVALADDAGRMRFGLPTMVACAPVLDEDSFQVVGVLALQIAPEEEFSRILQLGRLGATGETYAFNKEGMMVSGSRFDDELILLGILPDKEQSQSILNVMLRDPGGNMLEGFRPKVRRASLPLTKMASAAIAGNSGVDVEGYRDYRGVPVVAPGVGYLNMKWALRPK